MKVPRRAPREVRDRAQGRILAWARAEPDGWFVAQRERCWCTAPDFDVDWKKVQAVAWSAPILDLTIGKVVDEWDIGRGRNPGGVSALPENPGVVAVMRLGIWRTQLEPFTQVPQVVRERVMQSLVAQRALDTSPGGVVAARRDPDGADVTWQYVLPAGIEVPTAGQREAALTEIAELGCEWGV